MRRALYCLARYCAFTVVSPFKLLSRRSLHMPKESLSSARLDFRERALVPRLPGNYQY